jgi:hypothetical protein
MGKKFLTIYLFYAACAFGSLPKTEDADSLAVSPGSPAATYQSAPSPLPAERSEAPTDPVASDTPSQLTERTKVDLIKHCGAKSLFDEMYHKRFPVIDGSSWTFSVADHYTCTAEQFLNSVIFPHAAAIELFLLKKTESFVLEGQFFMSEPLHFPENDKFIQGLSLILQKIGEHCLAPRAIPSSSDREPNSIERCGKEDVF